MVAKEEEAAELKVELESLKSSSERQIVSLAANVSSLENIVSSMEGEMAAMEKELNVARQRIEDQPTQPTVTQSRASSRASSPGPSAAYSDTDTADATNTDTISDTNDGTGGSGEGVRLGRQRARGGTIFHHNSDRSSESESEGADRDGGGGNRDEDGVGGGKGGDGGDDIGVATLDVTTTRYHLSASPATPTATHTTDHPHRGGEHGHDSDHDHSHADSPNLRTPHQHRQQHHHNQRAASPRYPIDHYRNPNSPNYTTEGEVQAGGDGGGGGGSVSGGLDPRLSMVALHAPKLVSLGAGGDRRALTAFFVSVAQDILSGRGGGGGGGGEGSISKVDVAFHPSPHRRHGETHLAIHHAETGALVATLIISSERTAVASSLYGGGDERDAMVNLTTADRGILQAWGSFLGGCIDMIRLVVQVYNGCVSAIVPLDSLCLPLSTTMEVNSPTIHYPQEFGECGRGHA